MQLFKSACYPLNESMVNASVSDFSAQKITPLQLEGVKVHRTLYLFKERRLLLGRTNVHEHRVRSDRKPLCTTQSAAFHQKHSANQRSRSSRLETLSHQSYSCTEDLPSLCFRYYRPPYHSQLIGFGQSGNCLKETRCTCWNVLIHLVYIAHHHKGSVIVLTPRQRAVYFPLWQWSSNRSREVIRPHCIVGC